MSQKKLQREPSAIKTKTKPQKRKFFSRDNFSKIILPSLFLLGLLLTPVIFEAFNVRHQKIDDIVDAPFPGNWYNDLFDSDTPTHDIDPDDNETDDFMEGFTNGLSDPERILFRITPNDEYFYWRLETYDHYTMDSWSKNITAVEINGYSSLPPTADGQFTIETLDMGYLGGTLVSYYPAPYHYLYSERFSDNYFFTPSSDWNEQMTTMQEDIYGCKLINAHFETTSGNTSLTYQAAYTIQNNSYIKESSLGFSALNSILTSNPSFGNQYLQLPESYSQHAIDTHQLANDLLEPSVTIYEQVYRDLIWLSLNCQYDVAMLLGESNEGPASGEDYVEWFLDRRMGTAAHFAAALAMICRIQNIPSRIVIGFSYGEVSGGEFIIRAKHVHSWVELFIPFSDNVGYWVAFDPSPLLPQLDRDRFGENIIGFNSLIYCSNEFFLSPQHMIPQTSYPYFIPNPLSNAWYSDPYNPSNWYGPYINRSVTFSIYAFLANGEDQDFLQYILTGDPGNLDFIAGENITFIDTTENAILGYAITDSDGKAQINYSYSLSARSGLHYIVAEWMGVQIPTYDLRYIPLSYIETGVIVSGSVNITSREPLLNLYQIKNLNQENIRNLTINFHIINVFITTHRFEIYTIKIKNST